MKLINDRALDKLECVRCKGTLSFLEQEEKFECRDCKVRFGASEGILNFLDNNIAPNVKNQIDYYDKKAARVMDDPDLFCFGLEKMARRYTLKPLERLGVSLESLKAKEVLQVGSGEALQSYFFAQHGAKTYGFDVSPGMIKAGKFLAKYRGFDIDLFVADAENKFPFRDNSFDIVFANSVLNHIKDTKRGIYVNEKVRIVRPGGLVFDTVPNHENYHWRTKTYRDLMGKDGVEEFLSVSKKEILLDLYEKAGLENIVFWPYERVKARYDEGKKFLTVLEKIIYALFRIKSKRYPHFLFQSLLFDIEAFMDDKNIWTPLLYKFPHFHLIAGWKKDNTTCK